jgi:hypothetical protein
MSGDADLKDTTCKGKDHHADARIGTERRSRRSKESWVKDNNRHTTGSAGAGASAADRKDDDDVRSWASFVWPQMKRKIWAVLEAAQTRVLHRDRSFELLGFDVLVDDHLQPWILEVGLLP